jgi:hypothetical protein
MYKSLDLACHSFPGQIVSCHSSLGSEFGGRIALVKDAQHRLRRRAP